MSPRPTLYGNFVSGFSECIPGWYYYRHTNGKITPKNPYSAEYGPGTPEENAADYFDSPFVVTYWKEPG